MFVVRRKLASRFATVRWAPFRTWRAWWSAGLSFALLALALAGGEALSQGGCGRCGSAPVGPVAATPQRAAESPPIKRQVATLRLDLRVGRPKWGAFGGSYVVCVRSCDGSFFPVSYVATRESLAEICQALCPNAETQLYSMPFGGTIEGSVSVSGLPYVSLPNAGKFEEAVDQDCSCRRKGQSWAEALSGAEALLQRHPGDILVTPGISEQMSRPAAAPQISVAKAQVIDAGALALVQKPEPPSVVIDANGVDFNLNAAAAAVSRETSGIGVEETGGAHYGLDQGRIVEQKGADGSVKRVRIVVPPN